MLRQAGFYINILKPNDKHDSEIKGDLNWSTTAET